MTKADDWLYEIKGRQQDGNELEFSARQFAAVRGEPWPNQPLVEFLESQVVDGLMRRIDHFLCPNPQCGETLDNGMLAAGECANCGLEFALEDEKPIASVRYRIVGKPSRDIPWMIVVHGFNTRGPWQEDLSWLIANKLRYAAPVLIYKYGWATIDVLSRPLQERQIKSLGRRMRKAIDYAKARGLVERPDIVAHSFGTHLFTEVLKDPEFNDLKFGRVITVGSIVRPDFDWTSLAGNDRIGAVLNHMGGRDMPVLFAQYMIPGTGPGARCGYLDEHAVNQLDPEFDHSEALRSTRLQEQLRDGGLWERFLTQPEGNFAPDNEHTPTKWKAAWVGLRAVTRLIGRAIIIVFGPLSYIRRKFDP